MVQVAKGQARTYIGFGRYSSSSRSIPLSFRSRCLPSVHRLLDSLTPGFLLWSSRNDSDIFCRRGSYEFNLVLGLYLHWRINTLLLMREMCIYTIHFHFLASSGVVVNDQRSWVEYTSKYQSKSQYRRVLVFLCAST